MTLTQWLIRYLKRPRKLSQLLIRKLLLASLILAAGLATSACTPKLVAVKTDPCAGWSPIFASKQDVLTDGTAKQIQAHDCHGVAVQCWKDPAPAGKSVCPKVSPIKK